MLSSIDDVRTIQLPCHMTDSGDLVVIEGLTNIPFEIQRVFMVQGTTGSVRGMHAHKQCIQFLTCSSGSIEVICEDGERSMTTILNSPRCGLLIPAGIWSSQNYMTKNTTLTVLCDQHYQESDYIRNYDDFLSYRVSASHE